MVHKLLIPLLFLFAAPLCFAQNSSVSYIRAKMEAGWYEEANALLTPLVGQVNVDPAAMYLKARALLYMGNFQEAEGWAEKSVKAAPDSAAYWTMLGTTKVFQVRKSPLKGLTKGRSSKKNLEKGAKLDPTNTESVMAWLTFNLYAPGLVGGSKDKARQLAEDLFEVNPVQGHLARAQIYRHTDDDLTRARIEMDAAVTLNADDPQPCYDLAETLMREGFPEDALDYYRLGAERDADAATGAARLGSAYLRQEMISEAQDSFDRALATDPANSPAVAGQGLIYLAQGQNEAALALFEDLVRIDPPFLPAKFYLAKAYVVSGIKYQEAAQLLREYLDGYLNFAWPSRALAHWHLALAQEKLGAYNEAWDNISLAMELPRGDEKMKHDAQRLEFMAND